MVDIKKGWWKQTEKGFEGKVTTYELNIDLKDWNLLKVFNKNNKELVFDFIHECFFQFSKENSEKKGIIYLSSDKKNDSLTKDFFGKRIAKDYRTNFARDKIKNLHVFNKKRREYQDDLNFINKDNPKILVYNRAFNPGYYLSGRFYSQFNSLPKVIRNPIAESIGLEELDYSSMMFKTMYELLYGMKYTNDIYTDLYKKNIIHVPSEFRNRQFGKGLLIRVINNKSENATIKSITKYLNDEYNTSLPKEVIKKDIIDRFFNHFQLFKIFKYKSNSLWTQRIESNTINKLMLSMKKNNDYPISIHDAILVPKEKVYNYGIKMSKYLTKEIENWKKEYTSKFDNKKDSDKIYLYYSKKIPKYAQENKDKYNKIVSEIEKKYDIVKHYYESNYDSNRTVYRTKKLKKYSELDILKDNVSKKLIKYNREFINKTFYYIKKDLLNDNKPSIPKELPYDRFIEDLSNEWSNLKINDDIIFSKLYDVKGNKKQKLKEILEQEFEIHSVLTESPSLIKLGLKNLNSQIKSLNDKSYINTIYDIFEDKINLNNYSDNKINKLSLIKKTDDYIFLLSSIYSYFIKSLYIVLNNKYKREYNEYKKNKKSIKRYNRNNKVYSIIRKDDLIKVKERREKIKERVLIIGNKGLNKRINEKKYLNQNLKPINLCNRLRKIWKYENIPKMRLKLE